MKTWSEENKKYKEKVVNKYYKLKEHDEEDIEFMRKEDWEPPIRYPGYVAEFECTNLKWEKKEYSNKYPLPKSITVEGAVLNDDEDYLEYNISESIKEKLGYSDVPSFLYADLVDEKGRKDFELTEWEYENRYE